MYSLFYPYLYILFYPTSLAGDSFRFQMRTSTRRLVVSLLYFGFGYVFPSGGLFIPSTSGLLKRAETPDFVTMYGIFDHTPPEDSRISIHGSSRLRPVAEVLITMKVVTPTLSPTFVSTSAGATIDQPRPDASPLLDFISSSSSADAVFTTSVPHFGPGLVVPPSSVYQEIISPTSRSNSTALTDKTGGGGGAPRQFIVLGTIVGGIIFFAVCVFLLMSPICSGPLFGCGKPKKAIKKTENDEDLQKKAVADTTSWVSIPNPSKRGSLENVKDTIINIAPVLESFGLDEVATPASKFSVCSSEYPPSSLTSTISSDLASSASTIKVTHLSTQQASDSDSTMSPIRPPRPPTADSPALSESVYFACSDSDQPYVIVAPQPLSEEDLQTGIAVSKSSRKILTASEFAALHVRIAIGRLAASTNKRTSSLSRHSRTKSAPAIGQHHRNSVTEGAFATSKAIFFSRKSCGGSAPTKKSVFKFIKSRNEGDECDELLEDIENDSDVQESMVRRVMKHRRSRSASGWAYPSRGRMTRRPFKLEEE